MAEALLKRLREHAPALLRRFPLLRAPNKSDPVIPEEPDKYGYPGRGAFAQLAPDFHVLDQEVASTYAGFDKMALREQHHYRRQQVLIILGSALVTGLGGLQAVFPHKSWPGIVLGILSLALVSTSALAKERKSLDSYLSARLKAERLRALHFEYLSETGQYAGPGRKTALRHAVAAIEDGVEPQ
jgi:hypothetical protein